MEELSEVILEEFRAQGNNGLVTENGFSGHKAQDLTSKARIAVVVAGDCLADVCHAQWFYRYGASVFAKGSEHSQRSQLNVMMRRDWCYCEPKAGLVCPKC